MKALLSLLIITATFQVNAFEGVVMMNNCETVKTFSGEVFIGQESGKEIKEEVVVKCEARPGSDNPYCQQQQQQHPQRYQEGQFSPPTIIIRDVPVVKTSGRIYKEYSISHTRTIEVAGTVYRCGN